MTSVQFYDVMVGGNRTTLTRPQITGLFQAGQLLCTDLCKEAERAEWRTIDVVFPLLSHGTTARSLYQPTELDNPHARRIALAVGISILVISVALVAGYFAFRGSAGGAKTEITAKEAANPSAPVSYAVENPYLLSPKAQKAEEERLNAARRAREQAQVTRLAQERAEAEKRERELQTAAAKTKRAPTQQPSATASRKPRK